ncbi:MAG: thiamine diphosphokinase [Oscillospiraceae bacterium]|nr:thiamine diphosphokinase [Oscillospiraceae bacterium]
MSNCIIFCAGGFECLAEPIQETDYIIAADGGYRHTQALGLTPDAILGDFDSLDQIPAGATVFPVEKDDTDAMLAVRHGLEKGYKQFILYGALDGPRLDHTIANLQTLLFLADNGAEGCLVGNTHIATTVTNSRTFPAEATGIVSMFCLGKDATGVTLENLKYPLENGTLTAGFPLGVSNHFTGKSATVSVKNGTLLIICDRQNGLI